MKILSNLISNTLGKSKVSYKNHKSKSSYSVQDEFFKTKQRPTIPTPVNEFLENPTNIKDLLTFGQKRVFNEIIRVCRKYPNAWISQITIAAHTGYSRSFVNKAIRRIESLGLLSSIQRYNNSNLYALSSVFESPYVQSQLSHLFPALRWITLIILFPLLAHSFRGNTGKDTLLYKRDMYISPTSYISPGEVSMNSPMLEAHDTRPISPVVKELSQIVAMTTFGMIKLSAFPDEAVVHATQMLIRRIGQKNLGAINNPYKWVYSVANRYCGNHDLKPDWHYVQQMQSAYQMGDDAKLLFTNEINKDGLKDYIRRYPQTTQDVQENPRVNTTKAGNSQKYSKAQPSKHTPVELSDADYAKYKHLGYPKTHSAYAIEQGIVRDLWYPDKPEKRDVATENQSMQQIRTPDAWKQFEKLLGFEMNPQFSKEE